MDKTMELTARNILPQASGGMLVGRVWAESAGGACPDLVQNGEVVDLSQVSPTMSGLLERDDRVAATREGGPTLGPLDGFLDLGFGKGRLGRLLAPCDLQAIKAAGVTNGAMLCLGTMFAPTKDRDGKGLGFTHKSGDVVSVSSPLGRLVNRVQPCHAVEPWTFGTRALMGNLSAWRMTT